MLDYWLIVLTDPSLHCSVSAHMSVGVISCVCMLMRGCLVCDYGQRQTERSHKYVYLSVSSKGGVEICAPKYDLRACVCARPIHPVRSHRRAPLCASLCLRSRSPNDEIQITNIKARIAHLDATWMTGKILAWQWYAFYAITLMVNKNLSFLFSLPRRQKNK